MTDELVGREREMARLHDFLEPRPDGLRVALLVGEPGIGKSSLWERAIAAGHERSTIVLTSRPAETERRLSNLVLGDLFRDVDPSLIASLPGPRRRAFEAALLIGDPADASVDRRALGVAVATVLHSMAQQRTVLIAIDDDQWMDAPSAETLAFAVRRLLDHPIRLLLSRRARGRPPVNLERLVESGGIERLDIGPLSVGATQLLLRERLGVTLARPTLREIHHVSGGNPFHALELGRARSRDASRDLALPLGEGSVDELLRGRLRELDEATKWALLVVAAHGRTPIELLATLDVASEVIDHAVHADLLTRSENVVGFAHPLLAAAVYDGAGTDLRQAAHRLLAEATEDPVHRGRHVALGAAESSASSSVRNLSRIAVERAAIRWSQVGFGQTSRTAAARQTLRNLFGFKDGTNNIVAAEQSAVDRHVWFPPGGTPAWLAGGTYLVVRKIEMLIEDWDHEPLASQQAIFGRAKRSGAPLSGGKEFTPPDFAAKVHGAEAIDRAAHIRLADASNNGGLRILRRGYNYVDGTNAQGRLDAGLLFIAFQRSPGQFVTVQRALATDLLNEYIRHIGSAIFVVPPGASVGGFVGETLLR